MPAKLNVVESIAVSHIAQTIVWKIQEFHFMKYRRMRLYKKKWVKLLKTKRLPDFGPNYRVCMFKSFSRR